MPMVGSPLVASRPEPARPVRLPQAVKDVITAMVEEGLPWTAAAQQHGVQLQRMRKWFGRPETIAYLRAARARFRQCALAGNEHYLVAIRGGDNAMAAVAAIKTLEQISDTEVGRPLRDVSPGVTIVIRQPIAPSAAANSRVGSIPRQQ